MDLTNRIRLVHTDLASYLFFLLKHNRRMAGKTTNITPPTEAPIMMAFTGFRSSSLSSLVSVATIKSTRKWGEGGDQEQKRGKKDKRKGKIKYTE